MTWAGRRQLTIISILTLIILAILILIFRPVVAPNPTCFDKRQNGSERGVDCGGTCSLACTFETSPISILWTRSFKVADGVYNAVAYISNPNASFEAKNVPYSMKLYDDQNILVSERTGQVNISAKSATPIFEGGIQTGHTNVKQTFFTLTKDPVWQKSLKDLPKVSISSPIFEALDNPQIRVSVTNNNSLTLKNIPVVAIVYDKNGNAINASRTIVDRLEKDQSSDLVFTWLSPFSDLVSRIEVAPNLAN